MYSYGVVREGDILARWTFDEGNGSVATDVAGGGLDLLVWQSPNQDWGLQWSGIHNLGGE